MYFVQPLRSDWNFKFLKEHSDPHCCSLFVENIRLSPQMVGRTSVVKLKLQSSILPDSHSSPIELAVLILKLLTEF